MQDLKELEAWFLKALDIPENERIPFLEKNLSSKPKLLTRVLELISHNERSVLTELKEELSGDVPTPKPKIDKYTLMEELGRGGMAIVFRGARADGVFDHEVAVKVLKAGLNEESFVGRFSHERNMLGRLKHENIAQIYDGGLTVDRRPYFVMELVKGQDILSYAETKKLSLDQRVSLFLKVCAAIRHAHQNLIIHTDIKPSNVLVNERGEVKLTDFGIAQLIDESNDTQSIFTPRYASPEQLRGAALDVRTDVFQLGELLKELTGSFKLPKDLQVILFHAIQKDLQNRYASVDDLKRDIENFSAKKPIQIKGSSPAYFLKKYIQRNTIPFSMAVAFFLIVVISTYLYINSIQKANQEILDEKRLADDSLNLLLKIFSQAYPDHSGGDTLTVFDLLHLGDSILTVSGNTTLKGRFSHLIGDVYSGYNNNSAALGFYKKSADHFKEDIKRINTNRNLLFESYAAMAGAYINLDLIDSAYYFMKRSQAYANENELRDAYRPVLLGSLAWMEVNRGNNELADSLYQAAVDIYEYEHDSTLSYANQLAYYGRFLNYWDTPHRKDEIDTLYKKSRAVFTSQGYDTLRPTDYARLVNYQGLFHLDLQDYRKAERHFEEAYRLNSRIFGEENLATLDNLNNLALIKLRQEQFMEAREKFRRCWNIAVEMGISPRNSLVYYHNYASTFNLLGEYGTAKVKFDSLIAARKESSVFNLGWLNLARIELSRSHVGMKQYIEGKRLLNQVILSHQEELGDTGVRDIQAAIELVKLYRKSGQEEEAVAQYEKNKALIRRRFDEQSVFIAKNEEALEDEKEPLQ